MASDFVYTRKIAKRGATMASNNKLKGYDGIFATRFRELLKLRKRTQNYVAIQTNSKGQTISQYVNGDVLPNAEKLHDIAQCLDVSADYLLGMSDVMSSDVDDKAINQMLGLSDKAIAALKTTSAAACVNALLEEPEREKRHSIRAFANRNVKSER